MKRRPDSRRRGVSLVEALVAMAVMAFGMLALVGVQATLRMNSDLAKQRSEATRIATEELESLRAFQSVPVVAGQAGVSYDEIASRTVDAYQPADDITSSTTYGIVRTVNLVAGTQQKVVSVQVSWNDNNGVGQTVTMDSVISGTDPRLSGLLTVPVTPSAPNQRGGRHPSIPPEAVAIPSGKSAFKPFNNGTSVWVFDNVSGDIVSFCTGVSALQQDIDSDDLTNCQAISALLLAGEVNFNFRRYNTANLVDSSDAYAVVKPIDASTTGLKIDRSTDRIIAKCTVPADKALDAEWTVGDLTDCQTVSPSRLVEPFELTCASETCTPDPATGLVPFDAEAPHWPRLNLSIALVGTGDTSIDNAQFNQTQTPECVTDAPTSWSQSLAQTERTVRYYCRVYQGSGGWGGRINLQPLAFSDTGETAWQTSTAGLKVCRYTQASTQFTVNRDHPATYCMERSGTPTAAVPCTGNRVTRSLFNQNFLVIGGNQSCPVDGPVDPATGNLVNSNTLQHQP